MPEVVRQATLVTLAVLVAATTRGIDILVDRDHNLCHGDLVGCHGERVAAAWAAHAVHQAVPAQTRKELLKIRQGDALTFGDFRKGYGALLVLQRQIQHGGYRIASFGCQFHGAGPRVKVDLPGATLTYPT